MRDGRSRMRLALALALVAGLGLVACSDDDDGGSATSLNEGENAGVTTSSVAGGGAEACHIENGLSTKGTDLVVTLSEWKVELAQPKVAPGVVSFIADNAGEEPHELVIVKGSDPKALKTNENGGLEEEAVEADLLGEIEPFAGGSLCRGNFALEAGTYILACNIEEKEEDGTIEAHYKEGMVTTLAVG